MVQLQLFLLYSNRNYFFVKQFWGCFGMILLLTICGHSLEGDSAAETFKHVRKRKSMVPNSRGSWCTCYISYIRHISCVYKYRTYMCIYIYIFMYWYIYIYTFGMICPDGFDKTAEWPWVFTSFPSLIYFFDGQKKQVAYIMLTSD